MSGEIAVADGACGSMTRADEAAQLYRVTTNAAALCGEIVKRSVKAIGGRRFVSVEGWQAISIAHGCVASSTDVERVDGGVRATGLVRRMSDGVVIAQAEGFVGEDEPVWFGGKDARGRVYPARAMYAIRAMAQTRAISRACRSAFAHVVVLIDEGLSTTPYEEVPHDEDAPVAPPAVTPTPAQHGGNGGAKPPRAAVVPWLEAAAAAGVDPRDWDLQARILTAHFGEPREVNSRTKLPDEYYTILAAELPGYLAKQRALCTDDAAVAAAVGAGDDLDPFDDLQEAAK